MSSEVETSASAALDPERMLALSYLPKTARGRVETLWHLDERLARLGATESPFREVKLAWWDEQLAALGGTGHPEPLLAAVARDLLPKLAADRLAGLAAAWRALDGEGPQALYEAGRATLFALTADLVGSPLPPAAADSARLWARADLRRRRPDLVQAEATRRASNRWPAPLRGLGALANLATRDLEMSELEPRASPRRVGRMAWHRLTGL